MSRENAEVVRTFIDALNRRDWDAALAVAAPDVVIDASGNAGEWRGVHRGRDQVKRACELFVEPWESVRVEVEDYIDAGKHVVTRMTGRFMGRDGIEVQAKVGWCLTLHDELVTHVLAANDFEVALKAAGLSE